VNEEKTIQIKKKIVQILDKHLGDNYLLFVFGSYAKGRIARSSDIDLAVYRNEKIPSSIIIQAKDDMEKEAGTLRDIDLINLTDEFVGVNLLKSVLKEGIIWKKARNYSDI